MFICLPSKEVAELRTVAHERVLLVLPLEESAGFEVLGEIVTDPSMGAKLASP
jgi:hypothetical protein